MCKSQNSLKKVFVSTSWIELLLFEYVKLFMVHNILYQSREGLRKIDQSFKRKKTSVDYWMLRF
jgi:hypothetical protein